VKITEIIIAYGKTDIGDRQSGGAQEKAGLLQPLFLNQICVGIAGKL